MLPTNTLLLTLAALGTALGAASPHGASNQKLSARAALAQWSNSHDNGDGSTWASSSSSCDADNDCPRICRNEFGKDAFSDEGTKCCSGQCACSGGCGGNGGANECDADNDCPRVCRDRYGVDVEEQGVEAKCCSGGTCDCYGDWCGH
ncbi:hypothetical protein SLS58_000001 [Diplodia intermedia]|uniref:Uncharacterized protein n=1 Tax=Diplodia intermedia TaxID=856260 RepID=A0ABR3U615_9PEZI